MRTYKDFGTHPHVSVDVTEKDDILDTKAEVRVNWSCVGRVSIQDAMEFSNNLNEALGFARLQAARLGLRLD